MATEHDLADAFQLKSTPGWQTLLAILQSTGERIPKRSRDDSMMDDDDGDPCSPFRDSETEHLAKRVAAVRLNRTWEKEN